MTNRRNLISKKTGIGDHMSASNLTDVVFPKAVRYNDVISDDLKIGQCIKNQYVTIDWIKILIGTKQWRSVGKENSLYEYFVDTDSVMKPNMKNYATEEELYRAASGDMQFDFDDLTDDVIEKIRQAFLSVSAESPVYHWFEYSWSHCNEHHLSGCHVRIYAKLKMKTRLEWGFWYITQLNSLLKRIDDDTRSIVINSIDWSCCTVTRGFAIPYNENGVTLGLTYDESHIPCLESEDMLDEAFKRVSPSWYDELFDYYYNKIVVPKKRTELKRLGLLQEDEGYVYRYTMEDDWHFDENHPIVDGETYNYNWRLSLVTTLMGVFNDRDIVHDICAVIYRYIREYKNHTYEEMIGPEFEQKIMKNANFNLEPSHEMLKELWNDWGLKISIRKKIV